jgi:hypothetical protein
MKGMYMINFFLGVNSYNGFYSLYDKYIKDNAQVLYILKGSVRYIKTQLLGSISRCLASQGYEIHYILNPLEPDIPDGISIPSLKTVFIDGSRPQLIEPSYPCERDRCIELSGFIDSSVSGVKGLTDACKRSLDRANQYMAAAGSISKSLSINEEAKELISKRARGLIDREIKRTGRKKGRETRFFIDSFTYKGLLTKSETIHGLCTKLISLDNGCDSSKHLLQPLAEAALNRGYDIICCPSPFAPTELWHLLIPELSLGFISTRGGRRLHLDKIVYDSMSSTEKQAFKAAQALREQLLSGAAKELSDFKQHSDRLDDIYKPHTNLEMLNKYAEDCIKNLLFK